MTAHVPRYTDDDPPRSIAPEQGLVASRARARDAIQRGTVKVDGRTVTKPASTSRKRYAHH